MAAYLGDAWLEQPLDPAAEAFAALGGSLTIGRIVSGAPDGEARFTATVSDGAVTYERGLDASAADVTLTDTFANAVAMVRGDLDPNAAFMRGHTKVTGATGQLLDLFAATKSERFEQARAELLGSVDL